MYRLGFENVFNIHSRFRKIIYYNSFLNLHFIRSPFVLFDYHSLEMSTKFVKINRFLCCNSFEKKKKKSLKRVFREMSNRRNQRPTDGYFIKIILSPKTQQKKYILLSLHR